MWSNLLLNKQQICDLLYWIITYSSFSPTCNEPFCCFNREMVFNVILSHQSLMLSCRFLKVTNEGYNHDSPIVCFSGSLGTSLSAV